MKNNKIISPEINYDLELENNADISELSNDVTWIPHATWLKLSMACKENTDDIKNICNESFKKFTPDNFLFTDKLLNLSYKA